jgi:hypothetical protein
MALTKTAMPSIAEIAKIATNKQGSRMQGGQQNEQSK